MLDFLRQQVIEALAHETHVMLTTGGIAGLQTSLSPCESMGMSLFVLVPEGSDHLVNIEGQPECVAVTERWQLRGVARRTSPSEHPTVALGHAPSAMWSVLVEIQPTRLQVAQSDGNTAATIDIDESSGRTGG